MSILSGARQAKNSQTRKTRRSKHPPEPELAIAYLKGEVSISDIVVGMGETSSAGVYSLLARSLKVAYEYGMIADTGKPSPVAKIEGGGAEVVQQNAETSADSTAPAISRPGEESGASPDHQPTSSSEQTEGGGETGPQAPTAERPDGLATSDPQNVPDQPALDDDTPLIERAGGGNDGGG
jgi:hypothetical protein